MNLMTLPEVETRRPTWFADPATHATDRVVLRDGDRVGRVMRIAHGPQAGRWQWSGLWIGVDNRGVVDGCAGWVRGGVSRHKLAARLACLLLSFRRRDDFGSDRG